VATVAKLLLRFDPRHSLHKLLAHFLKLLRGCLEWFPKVKVVRSEDPDKRFRCRGATI